MLWESNPVHHDAEQDMLINFCLRWQEIIKIQL